MNKIILSIVCFFCFSLISNLAVADKPEWVEKKQAEHEARKAKKETKKELRKAEHEIKKTVNTAQRKINKSFG